MAVPTRTDVVVGWRHWHWDSARRCLRSLIWGTEWPGFKALECYAHGVAYLTREERMGLPPELHEGWGIHAWTGREDLDRFISMTDRYKSVMGQVSLWGTIVEHEFGYRAQFAYPLMILVLPEDERLCRDISAAYGVEAMPANA